MAESPFYLEVDISQAMPKIEKIKDFIEPEQFDKLMQRTFNEVAKSAKTIISKDVAAQYAVKKSWAASHIMNWRQSGGGKIGVVIPISGARGGIGETFHASGGSGRKGGRKRVRARIVKGTMSTLPSAMTHQGGQPPFMAKGAVFTRKKPKSAYPIVHVVGLGVPQMPMNRSKEDVENHLIEKLEKRLEHNISFMFGK